MCLVSITNIPSISDKDIECYKILFPIEGKLITPYRNFIFNISKTYTDKKSECIDPYWNEREFIISKGFFHSYSNIESARFDLNRLLKIAPNNYKIYKAVIPSGTKFFKGIEEDLCSKSLKIIEEML